MFVTELELQCDTQWRDSTYEKEDPIQFWSPPGEPIRCTQFILTVQNTGNVFIWILLNFCTFVREVDVNMCRGKKMCVYLTSEWR